MSNLLKTTFTLTILTTLLLTACNKEQASFETSFSGLSNLGPDYAYEGWIIVNGNPKTAGIFTVDDNGNLSSNSFEVNEKDLSKASAYVLTIEPSPDPDPAPSSVHILGGDFSGNTASLTVAHGSAIGSDFTNAAGGYIIATPTTASTTDENSGVWFLDPNAGPAATLNLPTLPNGWEYEGWAVINGTPVSTGKFLNVNGADDSGIFSGDQSAPPFPGEDFIQNAPAGLIFPTDLSNSDIVITIEPNPDNGPEPFAMKPLVGSVPSPITNGSVYQLTNNAAATNPTGVINR